MKIKKSELKNIIDNGFTARRLAAKVKQKRGSEMTKEWKLRQGTTEAILKRLENSKEPGEQADALAIKKLLELISYKL